MTVYDDWEELLDATGSTEVTMAPGATVSVRPKMVEAGWIEGQVTDAVTGRGVSEAVVELYPYDRRFYSAMVYQSETDEDGYYTSRGFVPGTTLRASARTQPATKARGTTLGWKLKNPIASTWTTERSPSVTPHCTRTQFLRGPPW